MEGLLETANAELLQAHSSPGAFDRSDKSRLDRILGKLVVNSDANSVDMPAKGDKRSFVEGSSTFKRLRETVSDTLKDTLTSKTKVQSKNLRLRVIKASILPVMKLWR